MKTILYPICVLALLSVGAGCKNKKMAQQSTTATTTTTTTDASQTTTTVIMAPPLPPASPDPDATGGEALATDSDNNSRVVISFISRGEGIDNKALEAFETFLNEYRPVVQYEKVHWGREGEVDYCLKLSELSTKDQIKFVSDARIKLADTKLVVIEENVPCVHKR